MNNFDQIGFVHDNPFLPPNSNCHSQYAPTKVGGTTTSYPVVRIPKPPKPPEKPLMPYMRYSRKVWDAVKASHPDLKLWEIGKVIGQMWREVGSFEKQRFIEEYETEKIDYAEALKNYQNSPAYQQYLAAKALQDEKEAKNRVPTIEGKNEHRLILPPCDLEDDDLEFYSVRHLSAARYQRNHKLMQEIFNDNVVPDLRNVVTTQRLQGWKRQVETLMLHQRKLEVELTELENKFQSKKRSIEESSNNFQDKISKLKTPAADDNLFQRLVESEEQQLLNQYQMYLKRVEQAKEIQKIKEAPNVVTAIKVEAIASMNGNGDEKLNSTNSQPKRNSVQPSSAAINDDSMDGSTCTGLANGHAIDDDSGDTFGDSSDA